MVSELTPERLAKIDEADRFIRIHCSCGLSFPLNVEYLTPPLPVCAIGLLAKQSHPILVLRIAKGTHRSAAGGPLGRPI